MFICIKNTHKELQYGNYFLLRCLSVLPNIKEGIDNNHIKFKKKFANLREDHRLKPLNNSFINDFFGGKVNKEILKYPNIVQDVQTESLLQHINEIENYLNILAAGNVEINKDVLNNLQKLKLFGHSVPQKYGGMGYSETETNYIYEHLGICPKICNLVSYNENFGAKILKLYGTDEQKLKYLPKLASGESSISLAYLENGPLADVMSLKCNLIEDEKKDCFLINGEKNWVANVNISDLIIVLSKSKMLDGNKSKVKFNLNLLDKNSPGITVKEVQSNKDGLLGMYAVKFDNVIAQNSSFISSDTQCGISIIKNALSYSSLSNSVQCLSILKKILRYASAYSAKMVPSEKALNELAYIPNNIKWLKMYIYALESVIYLISGWFDEFDRPDLFAECNLAKILATNSLKSGINKYLQILGTECYRSSFLEEALQVLHHVSVFHENNIYLKSSIGCSGILHALKSSFEIQEVVKIRRQPYNYPWKSLIAMRNFNASRRIKSQTPEKFHPFLKKETDLLWWCLATLRLTVEKHLINCGNKATENDKFTAELADMATYTFTLAACISRASSSLYNKRPSSLEELRIVQVLACETEKKIIDLRNDISYEDSRPFLFKRIGDIVLNAKKYAIEHPLARSY